MVKPWFSDEPVLQDCDLHKCFLTSTFLSLGEMGKLEGGGVPWMIEGCCKSFALESRPLL